MGFISIKLKFKLLIALNWQLALLFPNFYYSRIYIKTFFVQIFLDYLHRFGFSVQQSLSWPTYGKMRTVKVAARDITVFHNKT
jgi:hypothetical protein